MDRQIWSRIPRYPSVRTGTRMPTFISTMCYWVVDYGNHPTTSDTYSPGLKLSLVDSRCSGYTQRVAKKWVISADVLLCTPALSGVQLMG